jgi:UDP-glucose 4-epimerase
MPGMSSTSSAVVVVGGAGYIGSHAVRLLAEAGRRIIVLDNLSHGHREAIVSSGVELVVGDMGDAAVVERVFADNRIDAVMHFAAFALVGESVREPLRYYRNNVAAPLVLLDAMRRHGCGVFILSSTAATYGDPQTTPMSESHPQAPINPYGWSKLMLERILADCEVAWGLRSACLRYFNAAGASLDSAIGEDHTPETHLIPRVLMAVTGEIPAITVFGTDYPTADGTCVRDFVHVLDLAGAHARALDHLEHRGASIRCNLGTGHGLSVREIIALAESVTGAKVPVEFGPRREGDPPHLVADPSRARDLIGWQARFTDPRAIVESAWKWLNGPKHGRYRRQSD